jgi:hypothetical protein
MISVSHRRDGDYVVSVEIQVAYSETQMAQKLKPITDAEVVPAQKAEFSRLVWAVPLFIMIHNSEEALTMPRWLHEHMPAVAQQYGLPLTHIPSPGELYLALAMGTAVPFLITFFCSYGRSSQLRAVPSCRNSKRYADKRDCSPPHCHNLAACIHAGSHHGRLRCHSIFHLLVPPDPEV